MNKYSKIFKKDNYISYKTLEKIIITEKENLAKEYNNARIGSELWREKLNRYSELEKINEMIRLTIVANQNRESD